jgi:hypothetical protein
VSLSVWAPRRMLEQPPRGRRVVRTLEALRSTSLRCLARTAPATAAAPPAASTNSFKSCAAKHRPWTKTLSSNAHARKLDLGAGADRLG